jgi:exodeoxyribonuclease-3
MMHKNLGMRIDYLLVTAAVPVRDAWVDREARKGKGASDHAPLVADVDL